MRVVRARVSVRRSVVNERARIGEVVISYLYIAYSVGLCMGKAPYCELLEVFLELPETISSNDVEYHRAKLASVVTTYVEVLHIFNTSHDLLFRRRRNSI